MDLLPLLTTLAMLTPPAPSSWLAERQRFPSQAACLEAKRFNDAYASYCTEMSRTACCPKQKDFFFEASVECGRLWHPWNALMLQPHEVAQELNDPEKFWSRWLPELRQRIGWEMYERGELAPPVPWERWGWVR